MSSERRRRVAIIGGGPVGLEAARRLWLGGEQVTVFEQHASVGGHILVHWPEVRTFTPWSMNVVAEAAALAGLDGAQLDAHPTGAEFVAGYLQPLAAALAGGERPVCLRLSTRVASVRRVGCSKTTSTARQRGQLPFLLLAEASGGAEQLFFDVVLDCSGTLSQPVWAWPGLASGGAALVSAYTPRRQQLAAVSRVVVVGGGFSALTTVAALIEQRRAVDVHWLCRNAAFAPLPDDPLPQRRQLVELGRSIATAEQPVRVGACTVFFASDVQLHGVHASDGRLDVDVLDVATLRSHRIERVDAVFSNCGYRPDVDLFSELQVHLCYATEGPMKLAAHLLATSGRATDCLQQSTPPDAAALLATTEPDFYILGHKSYGRSSLFLLRVGYQQVNAISSHLQMK